MKTIRLFYTLDLILIFLTNYWISGSALYSALYSLIFFVSMYSFRSYDLEYMSSLNEQLVRNLAALMLALPVLYIAALMLPLGVSKFKVASGAISTLILEAFLHKIYFKIYQSSIKPVRYLVIGKKDELKEVFNELQEKSLGKLQFVDFINPSPQAVKERIKTGKIDALLIADPSLEEKAKSIVQNLGAPAVQIHYLPNLVETYLKRIPIEVATKFKEYYEISFNQIKDSPAKRVLDIAVALLALIIFSPLMLIVALAILIEDKAPIVFKQKRVGKDGKEFVMYKFRSMKNISRKTPKFADQEQHIILKVGKIIRPFRLDETLQFVNILKGDMSIVGPRPEQVEFSNVFSETIPFYKDRLRVKPGLTGWAQIMYKYSSTLEEVKKKLSYDLWYVKNRTIFLDISIILQTIEAIFWKRGAR